MIDYTGQQIGNYSLMRRLGIGGFASVYQGQHVRIATQHAAVKILHLSDVDTQKFQQEAETTAVLVHPNIIRLFDFDLSNGLPFLVMDYAPGGSLRTRHPQGTQLPLPTIVEYVRVLAGALQFAHDKNIIHRDMKPENILIGTYNELRLSDFGIAVLSQTGRTTLNPGYGTGGTPFYMAPEQCKGKPEKASDQYALAIMAYEWLSGTPPFTEGNAINIQYQHTYEPVPPLRQKRPELSEEIEHIILTALAKDPKERFATVQAFALALETAVQRKHDASNFIKPSNTRQESMPQQQVMPVVTNYQPITTSKQANQSHAAKAESKEMVGPNDGKTVLQRVRTRNISSDWKVYSASKGGMLVGFMVLVTLGALSLVFGILQGSYYAIGGIILCILLSVGSVLVYRSYKDDVLVLMPEGVVLGNQEKQVVRNSIDYRYVRRIRVFGTSVYVTVKLPGEEQVQKYTMRLNYFTSDSALAQNIERAYHQFMTRRIPQAKKINR